MNDYSAYGIGHNQSDLPEITKLAEQTFAAQQLVEQLEAQLKTAKEDYRKLSEQRLPEAMDSVGLTEYKTTSGISIEVEEKVRGRLTVEKRPAGYAWLESNGFGALVKSEVVVAFGRTHLEEAQQLVDALRASGKVANLEKNVHHSTLDAFIREQLEAGKDIPLDIFSVDRNRVAKINIGE